MEKGDIVKVIGRYKLGDAIGTISEKIETDYGPCYVIDFGKGFKDTFSESELSLYTNPIKFKVGDRVNTKNGDGTIELIVDDNGTVKYQIKVNDIDRTVIYPEYLLKGELDYCKECESYACRLHKDMPFCCFEHQCYGSEPFICKGTKGNPLEYITVKKWIKNHPNWKGIPHMKYWFYCDTQQEFDDFIDRYPDADNAPNDSWKRMYDIITLK